MRRVAAIAVFTAGIAAGCGADAGVSTSPPSSEVVPAIDTVSTVSTVSPVVRRVAAVTTDHSGVSTWPDLPEEGVVYAAPLVVRGQVVDVAGPFWNAADGQKWEGVEGPTTEGGDYTIPALYREVTLRVDEVIRDDLDLVDGDEVVFVASGGGEGSDSEDPFTGGRFATGEDVVVFLGPDVLYMRETPLSVLRPFYHRLGEYPIDGDTVTLRGPDPETVAVDEFISLIKSARESTDPEWESYRTSHDDVAALIDSAMRAIETGELDLPPDTP